MLKWLGGCLVVVLVVVAGGSWWGYQMMKGSLAPDGSARVAIAASPHRVFASLADGDSIVKWMGQGNIVSSSRSGPLVPGTRIRIQIRSAAGLAQQPMDWVIRQVVQDTLVVRELVTDHGQLAALRRDSLSASGDSTVIISSVVSPMIDSAVAGRQAQNREPPNGMAGMTGDLMLSMFRIQSKLELQALKAHIENRAASNAVTLPARK